MSFFKGWIILILCIYRIFCIHWSITGRLGYFHILAVVTVLQWTWEYGYLFEILLSILLDKYPEVGLLDQMAVLFLMFWGTSIWFSPGGCTNLHSHQVHKGSNFQTLVIFWLGLGFCCCFVLGFFLIIDILSNAWW